MSCELLVIRSCGTEPWRACRSRPSYKQMGLRDGIGSADQAATGGRPSALHVVSVLPSLLGRYVVILHHLSGPPDVGGTLVTMRLFRPAPAVSAPFSSAKPRAE